MSREAQIQRCLTIVTDMLRGALSVDGKPLKVSAGDILVLTPSNQLRSAIAERLSGDMQTIDVSTIHAARGLQRRITIIVGADDLRDRNLAYVGLTRPEELLVVLYSHDTPLIREMLHNIEVAQAL